MTEKLEKQIKDLMQTLVDNKIPAIFLASVGDQFIQSRNIGNETSAELLASFISSSEDMMEAVLLQFEKMRDLSEEQMIEKLESNGDTTATSNQATAGGDNTGS